MKPWLSLSKGQTISLGIILLILLIIQALSLFIWYGYITGHIFIAPRYEFSQLSEDAKGTELKSVVFSDDVKAFLNEQFQKSIDNKEEYIFCIDGDLEGDTASVTKLSQISETKIAITDYDGVTFESCKTNMQIHSHPNGTREASDTDIGSHVRTQKTVSCIQYGLDEFTCYKSYYVSLTT